MICEILVIAHHETNYPDDNSCAIKRNLATSDYYAAL
jgi:hypothetical protein